MCSHGGQIGVIAASLVMVWQYRLLHSACAVEDVDGINHAI